METENERRGKERRGKERRESKIQFVSFEIRTDLGAELLFDFVLKDVGDEIVDWLCGTLHVNVEISNFDLAFCDLNDLLLGVGDLEREVDLRL